MRKIINNNKISDLTYLVAACNRGQVTTYDTETGQFCRAGINNAHVSWLLNLMNCAFTPMSNKLNKSDFEFESFMEALRAVRR